MALIWLSLILLTALANATTEQLFLKLNGKYASAGSVSQCDDIEVTFGGGKPPYKFVVWADDQFNAVSYVPMDTAGTAIWSVQANPIKVSLYLKDSAGSSVHSQSLSVISGPVGCYGSTPIVRKNGQGTNSTPNGPKPSPDILHDCRQDGPAKCQFTPNGQSGVYFQQALIGNVFANCYSTKSVKQTFSGSTTITDNWSVQVGPEFGTPVNRISVITQVSRGDARTVTQTFEWDVDPGQQTALVAVGRFNCLYGGLNLNYSNGTSVSLQDAVYFQSTGEKATVTRLDIKCGEDWPSWNATTGTNGAGTMRSTSPILYGLGALVLALFLVDLL
ncbi:unnamed protein product [Rhizoctonia solani]|uniref:Uncharacterized protein n=1 Tax=Rhizoctonia solani TaxID=456999 RepID=A0A8H3H7E6_9AGAM|nr:unnamed protein product [Rhizoctonia solani]